MNKNYKYTKAMRDACPSLCHSCAKARKPAAKSLAEEGWVGCAGMFVDRRTPDEDPEVQMMEIFKGLVAKETATGWVRPNRLDSMAEGFAVITNGVLMNKGVTKCAFYELYDIKYDGETPSEPAHYKRYIAIATYGDGAYEALSKHEGETHSSKEWYDILSEGAGQNNPVEILRFNSEKEMLKATRDEDTDKLPKYWLFEGISDSAYTNR